MHLKLVLPTPASSRRCISIDEKPYKSLLPLPPLPPLSLATRIKNSTAGPPPPSWWKGTASFASREANSGERKGSPKRPLPPPPPPPPTPLSHPPPRLFGLSFSLSQAATTFLGLPSKTSPTDYSSPLIYVIHSPSPSSLSKKPLFPVSPSDGARRPLTWGRPPLDRSRDYHWAEAFGTGCMRSGKRDGM